MNISLQPSVWHLDDDTAHDLGQPSQLTFLFESRRLHCNRMTLVTQDCKMGAVYLGPLDIFLPGASSC